jgi:hypothetical protein
MHFPTNFQAESGGTYLIHHYKIYFLLYGIAFCITVNLKMKDTFGFHSAIICQIHHQLWTHEQGTVKLEYSEHGYSEFTVIAK